MSKNKNNLLNWDFSSLQNSLLKLCKPTATFHHYRRSTIINLGCLTIRIFYIVGINSIYYKNVSKIRLSFFSAWNSLKATTFLLKYV